MRIVVTGAAGFIGSNLVKRLNDNGIDNIIIVDDLTDGDKYRNIVDLSFSDYVDAQDFLPRLKAGQFGKIEAIYHQGACSDTMESNGRYMMRNNYEFSKDILDFCLENHSRMFYASSAAVYGGSSDFRPLVENEKPLNVYGYSKLVFDQLVRRVLPKTSVQIAGFRYFNVYGQREQHKGRMASVAFHHFNQYRQDGKVRLFGAYGGYEPGGHTRDFVYVGDVAAVNCWFLDNPQVSGIFNLGTGHAQPFNDVAHAVVNACRSRDGLPPLSLTEQVEQGLVEYIDFPDALKGKYQSFTQADITALRNAGYDAPFATVGEGVARYVETLTGVNNR